MQRAYNKITPTNNEMQRAYNGTTPCNGNNVSTMNNAYNENKAPVVV